MNLVGAPDSNPARREVVSIEPHRSAALRFIERWSARLLIVLLALVASCVPSHAQAPQFTGVDPMNVTNAASAVRAFRPKIVYPYHYVPSTPPSDVNLSKSLVGADLGIEVRLRKWY